MMRRVSPSVKIAGMLSSGRCITVRVSPIGILAAPVPAITAQEDSEISCAALYQTAVTDMMGNCFGIEPGTACGAAGDVSIEMMSGQTVEGAGVTAKASGVFALRARPGDGGVCAVGRDQLHVKRAWCEPG